MQRLKFFAVFVFLFVAALVFLFAVYYATGIKTIEVRGVSPDYPISGLAQFKGKNIFLLSSRDAELKIKNKNPYIKKIELTKNFPSTISFNIGLYYDEAELNVGTGYFMLSSDGRILFKNKVRPAIKPLINYYQKLNYYAYSAGDYLNLNDINDSIYYINLLEDLGLAVDSLDIKDKDMLLFNVGQKSVVFTTAKSRERQKYELGQIIREFKITGTDYKSIDLRFDKPIIKL
ncbi:MAG: cell division protein FtsQ/DivIB [Patescibacteria group bacterium]